MSAFNFLKYVYREIPRRITAPIFGNTLGLRFNNRWRRYFQKCKNNYLANNPSTFNKFRDLKKDRLDVLGICEVSELANVVDAYFADDNKSFSVMEPAYAVSLAPYIYDILKNISKDVESYLGSYFQPYWISIQRMSPGVERADSSEGWHIDDNPECLLKLFVYLNDVKANNGAFRGLSWRHTRKLLGRGFKLFDPENRIRYQTLVNKYLSRNPGALKILEGQRGSVLIFDNNLIHKATLPVTGYRHVIQISIYPSLIDLDLGSVEKSLLSPRARDYPPNPLFNDHGHI